VSPSEKLKRKKDIENDYLKLLELEINEEINKKIQNFMNNYYKNFSTDDKLLFSGILTQLNLKEFNMETAKVIPVLDYQLIGISLDESDLNKCRVISRYPYLTKAYNNFIEEKSPDYGITSVKIIDTIDHLLNNDNSVAGIRYEEAINLFFKDCIGKKNENLPKSLDFIRKVTKYESYDLFEYENEEKFNEFEKEYLNSLAYKAISFNCFFKNKTANLKHIDRGFFIRSTNLHELLLYTYDTTIADKSSYNNLKSKFLEIKADVSKCLKNIENLYSKQNLTINFKYKKHFYIIGIDFEEEIERNQYFESSIGILHEPRISKRLAFYEKHFEKVEKLKQEIKENDPELFGILDAKIKLSKTEFKDEKIFTFILKEIDI